MNERWAKGVVLAVYFVSDWLRLSRRKVDSIRRFAAALEQRGDEACHEVLATAAHVETITLAIEHELDALLVKYRIDR